MKKALSILICLAVLAMTLVAVIPASATDTPNIMALAGMDYQYYFAGDAATVAPDVTDGIVTPGEYNYSEDWTNVSTTPHTSDAHPYLTGIDASNNNMRGATATAEAGTDTMNVNIGYDAEWIYFALVADAPTAAFRPFGVSISAPNPTHYGNMMRRYTFWVKNAADCTGNTIAEGTHAITFDGTTGHITWGPRNYVMDAFGNQASLKGDDGFVPGSATGDIEGYLTYDGTANQMILEFKMKIDSIAHAFSKEAADINQLGLAFFHVTSTDPEAYQGAYKINYFMQLLDSDQTDLLVSTYDLDIDPAWVPYYVCLGNEADFSLPSPEDPAPSEDGNQPAASSSTTTTKATTTTAATTTAATTTAATTAAEEKGCGGVIGLSAIALVPCAVLGMAIATKKKED